MEVLKLIKGLPSPGISVGWDVGIRHHCPPAKVSALDPRAASGNAAETAPAKHSYLFPLRLARLWPATEGVDATEKRDEEVAAAEVDEDEIETVRREKSEEVEDADDDGRKDNWVLKILRVGSAWAGRDEQEAVKGDQAAAAEDGDRCVGWVGDEGCVVADDEEKIVFDRESFSRLLRKVSLAETELYAKMSYLGNLAYMIPKIEPKNLLKYQGLVFVTSSLDKKGKSKDSQEQKPCQDQDMMDNDEVSRGHKCAANSDGISPPAAYEIAASAASYLKCQTKSDFSSAEKDLNNGHRDCITSDEASFVATTNSLTSVVAAKEEMKQAVVKDLNSAKSLPSEWFICDDESSTTRHFVIQGSETLASWQTNLLFEPIHFEGFDVLVHRGIYEAAKGMYQQMLPEVRAHIKAYGKSATLRFTGHSLGGSLALLINLMLLIRGEAPASSLLPVITFGAPSVMCGGDYLLCKLGLPKSHVQAITMHRDIVPRAFSCNYPDHIAQILKAINGNFRNLPCLLSQKFLYSPMGKLLILQPDEKFSPHHHLLPPESGIYLLGNSISDSDDSKKLLQEAQSAFLNSPHPLEILSDRSAYGSEGTVYRDHDVNSYLRSVRYVIRQELKVIRKARREERRQEWWPLVVVQSVKTSVITAGRAGSANSTWHHFNFAGVLNGGRQTLKRLGDLVATHHVHMFVLLLLPARLFLLGTISH